MTTSTDGLIRFEYDEAMLHVIEMALDNLKGESRKVLKNAVNATARQARKDLVSEAASVYTEKKAKINKTTKVKAATNAKPEATVNVKGPVQSLKEFKTSVSISGVKAKILQASVMKVIQSSRGRAAAFPVKFESGHEDIAQRQIGEFYSRGAKARRDKWGPHADMTAIKTLFTNSTPKMLGGQKVFGVVEERIYENLMDNILAQIRKVVEKQ